MATKASTARKTKKKTTGKKTTGTAVQNVQEALRQEVASIQDTIASTGGGQFIRTEGGQFVLPDGETNDVLRAVIIDHISGQFYWDREFSPGNPTPPACFALGADPKNLAPSDNAPDKQSEECNSCPLFQWGSGGENRKACKSVRLLALMAPDADIDEGTMLIYRVPPTGLKAYDGYVMQVGRQFNYPPIGVITEIGLRKDKTFATPTFHIVEPNERVNEMYAAMKQAARDMLLQEPDVSTYEAPKSNRGRKR